MVNIAERQVVHQTSAMSASPSLSFLGSSNATNYVAAHGMRAGATVRATSPEQLSSQDPEYERLRRTTGLDDRALRALLATLGSGEDTELASSDSEGWLREHWGQD